MHNLIKSIGYDEVYNNPNLHPEDQDELGIPEGKLFKIINQFEKIIIF